MECVKLPSSLGLMTRVRETPISTSNIAGMVSFCIVTGDVHFKLVLF